jgi:hypothetical protein
MRGGKNVPECKGPGAKKKKSNNFGKFGHEESNPDLLQPYRACASEGAVHRTPYPMYSFTLNLVRYVSKFGAGIVGVNLPSDKME